MVAVSLPVHVLSPRSFSPSLLSPCMPPSTVPTCNVISYRKRYASPRNGTFATFNDLPLEIQGFIFALLNDSWANASASTISHVCQGWRTVVRSTPRAWRNVCFSTSHWDVDGARDFLNNSKTCSVDVEMVGHSRFNRVLRDVVPVLQDHLHRMRRLVLDRCNDKVREAVGCGLEGPAPRMESLSAMGGWWGRETIFQHFEGMSRLDGGRLQSVRLTGGLSIPWPLLVGLRHLDIGRMSTGPQPIYSEAQLLRSVQACPDLQTLSYEGHLEPHPDFHHIPILRLSFLTHLTVNADSWARVLSKITAPNLTELSVGRMFHNMSIDYTLEPMAISSLIDRSSKPPITCLEVRSANLDEEQWLRILSAVPLLRGLETRACGFHDDSMAALRLCPRLERWTTTWGFSRTRLLIDFLRTRNPPKYIPKTKGAGACIKYLEIVGRHPLHEAAMRDIEFMMLGSDPMSGGVFQHKFVVPAGSETRFY